MYNRILVPLDGSDLSERALQPALQLAEQFGSQVILLRVITVDETVMVAAGAGPQHLQLRDMREERDRAESEDYLRGILAQYERNVG